MNDKILNKLALKNIGANKEFIIPFLISNSLMFSLFFIFNQLLKNEVIKNIVNDYAVIAPILLFGTIFIGLLAFIFSVYGNKILIKNRYREFGLYSVLGMEKHHILKLILKENLLLMLIIMILSILFGYLIGAITFLGFTKIISNGKVLEFNFVLSKTAILITLVLIFATFIFNYLLNLIKIYRLNPVDLFSLSKKNEKEPKSKIILMLAGLLCLGYGYYLALTTEGLLKSITKFFIAVLFVTFGTYFLFTSLSIFVLKRLKANKNHYYKTENFINISNMLYRMKQNSVSLASITILTTSLVIAVGASAFSYFGSEFAINSTVPLDATFVYRGDLGENPTEEIINNQFNENKKILDEMLTGTNVEETYPISGEVTQGVITNRDGKKWTISEFPKNAMGLDLENGALLIAYDMQSINNYRKTKDVLNDGEAIVSKNGKYRNVEELIINGKSYKIRKEDNFPPSNVVSDFEPIVFKDMLEVVKISGYLNKNMALKNGEKMHQKISITNHIKFKDGNEPVDIKEKIKGKPYQYTSREQIENLIYSLNGGLLFVGLTVGLVLLIGTTLMMYYKQISEGTDDRENFSIMKKVGLPDELIKKTMNSQLKWIFFLPILVTTIHIIFANKILYNISSQFGIRDMKTFVMVLFGVLIAFIIIYFIIYKITSNVYYNIISRSENKI